MGGDELARRSEALCLQSASLQVQARILMENAARLRLVTTATLARIESLRTATECERLRGPSGPPGSQSSTPGA
jgi:hypothetical protein